MLLTPEIVLKIFRRISDEDCEVMGFSRKWCRPDWLICTMLPVSPPSVRPSIRQFGGQRSEDDITHKLHDIIKTNRDTYFTLVHEYQYHLCPHECPDFIQLLFPYGILWKGDKILELDQNGNILWEWSAFDEIGIENYNSYYIESLTAINNYAIDWTHANEIVFNKDDNTIINHWIFFSVYLFI